MRRSVARHDREVTPPAPRSPFLRAVRLQPRNADDYSDELPALRTLERIELDPRMHELLDQDGRFVVATHSPVLVGFPVRGSCSWTTTACARSTTTRPRRSS
jgi:hypothetical protein